METFRKKTSREPILHPKLQSSERSTASPEMQLYLKSPLTKAKSPQGWRKKVKTKDIVGQSYRWLRIANKVCYSGAATTG